MSDDVPSTGVVDSGNPPFRYRLRTRVEVTDTDLGGFVYYARYPHLLDRAVIEYRRHLGIPVLGPDGHLLVMRRLEVDYRSPARFDELVDVWVRTSEIGRTSHAMDLQVVDVTTGVLRCAARMVMVGVSDYDDGRSTRLPSTLAATLRMFEGETLAG